MTYTYRPAKEEGFGFLVLDSDGEYVKTCHDERTAAIEVARLNAGEGK